MFDQLSIVLKSYYFFVKIKTHHKTGFNKETSSSSLESILGFRNLHKTKVGEEVRAILVKVFKNGTSRILGRQPSKNFTWPILKYLDPYGTMKFLWYVALKKTAEVTLQILVTDVVTLVISNTRYIEFCSISNNLSGLMVI